MKFAIVVSLAICAVSQAHMGMSFVGVPAREKAVNGDNYRSPHGTKICQGTPKIGVQTTVAAGAEAKGVMSGGAAHGGGHCSMLVSTDEKKWYKIGDYNDCTTKGSLSFTMPKGVPTECDTDAGCTFGWLWTPMLSGTCEIYMNCYNIRVTGAMGGIEDAPNRLLELPIGNCVRPNSGTHLTTMFGFVIGADAEDPYVEGGAPPAPVTDPPVAGVPTIPPVNNAPITIPPSADSPDCAAGELLLATNLPATHTVAVEACGYQSEFTGATKAADEKAKCLAANTLSGISELYDLQCRGDDCNPWDAIYNLNKCTDPSIVHSCAGGAVPTCMASTPDQICVGQVLKLPQSECGQAPCGINGEWLPSRQKCLCEDNYFGAQCQFWFDAGGAGAGGGAVADTSVVAASIAQSVMVLCAVLPLML